MVCVWNFQCLLFVCLVIKAKIFKRKHAAYQSNGLGFVYKVKILKTLKVFIFFFKLAATSKEIKMIFFLNHIFKKVKKNILLVLPDKIMFYFLMVFSNKLTLRMYLFFFLKGAGYLRRCNFSKYIHTLPHM